MVTAFLQKQVQGQIFFHQRNLAPLLDSAAKGKYA